jgi:hypothetical protein
MTTGAFTNGASTFVFNNGVYINTGLGLAVGGNNLNGQSFYCAGGAGGPTGWQVISARKYKRNIAPVENALDLIQDPLLTGVHYTVEPPGDIRGPRESYGFIGDDWVERVPEVVDLDASGDVRLMDYQQVTPILWEAVKQYIAQTEARLAVLEGKAA